MFSLLIVFFSFSVLLAGSWPQFLHLSATLAPSISLCLSIFQPKEGALPLADSERGRRSLIFISKHMSCQGWGVVKSRRLVWDNFLSRGQYLGDLIWILDVVSHLAREGFISQGKDFPIWWHKQTICPSRSFTTSTRAQYLPSYLSLTALVWPGVSHNIQALNGLLVKLQGWERQKLAKAGRTFCQQLSSSTLILLVLMTFEMVPLLTLSRFSFCYGIIIFTVRAQRQWRKGAWFFTFWGIQHFERFDSPQIFFSSLKLESSLDGLCRCCWSS